MTTDEPKPRKKYTRRPPKPPKWARHRAYNNDLIKNNPGGGITDPFDLPYDKVFVILTSLLYVNQLVIEIIKKHPTNGFFLDAARLIRKARRWMRHGIGTAGADWRGPELKKVGFSVLARNVELMEQKYIGKDAKLLRAGAEDAGGEPGLPG